MPAEVSIAPSVILAMWAGGMALGSAAAIHWRVAGAGYVRTAAGATLAVGGFLALSDWRASVATLAILAAMVLARRPEAATALMALAGLGFLGLALDGRMILAVTGALALGGTSSEMLLGHWYLVDPRLPRWALKRLAGVGILGLVADLSAVAALGGLSGGGHLPWVFAGLTLSGITMMVGVWFSIGEKGYQGIMAATGLSYLAVLTTLGSVGLGRFLTLS